MGFITPPEGWESQRPPFRGSAAPEQQIVPQPAAAPYRQEQPSPLYSHDPATAYRYSQSFINDLRNMGGRAAGGLTFGTVFGATSGFLMARYLMTLLKVGVGIAVLVGFGLLASLGQSSSSNAAPTSDPASIQEPVAIRADDPPPAAATPIALAPAPEETSPSAAPEASAAPAQLTALPYERQTGTAAGPENSAAPVVQASHGWPETREAVVAPNPSVPVALPVADVNNSPSTHKKGKLYRALHLFTR